MLSELNDEDEAPVTSISSSSRSRNANAGPSKLMSLFSADEQWKSAGGDSALSYSAKRQNEKDLEKATATSAPPTAAAAPPSSSSPTSTPPTPADKPLSAGDAVKLKYSMWTLPKESTVS